MFNILGWSACCRPCRVWVTLQFLNHLWSVYAVLLFVLHPLHRPWKPSESSSSFCWGMFKLNAKFDADFSLHLLSHFECNGHTVHTLTQRCLPPPLTNTIRSQLFTHAHSSPLSLVARLHGCCANCSHYINNGWTFSGQASYDWLKFVLTTFSSI